MPSAMDYASIGEFYSRLRECFVSLSSHVGDAALFCGKAALQVGPDAIDLPGMTTVTCLAEALAALDTIVTQGEGGSEHDQSHFARFLAIHGELAHSQERGEPLRPAWSAARNPLMRKPSDPSAGVHVTEPAAAAVLDLGNAFYALTLRLLTQGWDGRDTNSGKERRRHCRRPCN